MRFAAISLTAAAILAGGVMATGQQETPPPPKKVDKAEVARSLRCQLPEGKGKETVVHLCADCHAARVVSTARKTPDQWLQTVETMADKGINAKDEEFGAVVDYLSAHLGPNNPTGADASKKDAPQAASKSDDGCPKQPDTPPAAPQHK